MKQLGNDEWKKKFDTEAGIEDKRLGSVLLVERLPVQPRPGKGTAGRLLWMVFLVFFFRQLHLEAKVVGCQHKSENTMKGPPFHGHSHTLGNENNTGSDGTSEGVMRRAGKNRGEKK